jgi:hypothetical protein
VRRLPTPGIAISRLAAALLAVLLLALTFATGASASSTKKILEACSEGKVPSGYSQQAYNQALKQMPPELSEYSPCPDLIHKAQLAAAAGAHGAGGTGGGSGGSGATAIAPPTPAEQHALENVTHHGAAPVRVGGEAIDPGVVHVDIASALSTLPTPLLALLAFLLACTLLILGRAVRTRIRARRHEA